MACLIIVAAQAQVVGANTQRESLIRPSKQVPEYRPTGGLLEFSLGFTDGIIVGKQLSSSLMLGGGIAVNYFEATDNRENWAIPLFFNARFGTPRYNFSLFLDLKAGIDLKYFSDINFLPVFMLQAGFAWRNLFFMGGIELFYDEYYGYNYYNGGWEVRPCFSLTYRIPFESIRKVLL